MENEVFIEKYLERIKYTGGHEVNLDNLALLQKLNLIHIPFENTGVLRKIPIILEKDALFKKLITEKRGGIFPEVKHLFNLLLEHLGYEVYVIGGRFF